MISAASAAALICANPLGAVVGISNEILKSGSGVKKKKKKKKKKNSLLKLLEQ
jgi:hypothetical protein